MDSNSKDILNEKQLLTEGRLLDYLIIFAIGIRFIKPFKKWKAFSLGLIDEKGNILKPPKSVEEKNAFTPLDNVILRIKRLIPARLAYLLTAAYIFKGFMNRRFRQIESEEKTIQKNIHLKEARKKVCDIIKNNQHFDEEEFWSYVANMRDFS